MADEKAPLVKTIEGRVEGQATAATDDEFIIGEAPFDGTVTEATYTTDAAITGHATTNRVFSIINKGQAGAGTTSVASLTTTLIPDNSFVAGDEKALTLSATPANLVVAAGDVLAFKSDAQSTGVVDPGGVVKVTIARDDDE